jgi:hypothetical protein
MIGRKQFQGLVSSAEHGGRLRSRLREVPLDFQEEFGGGDGRLSIPYLRDTVGQLAEGLGV